jgi:hypothetical protein
MKKKKGNMGKVLAVGTGLAVAGTAAYMLLGPDGKKNQAKVKKAVAKAQVKGKALMGQAMKKVASAERMMQNTMKKVQAVKKAAVKSSVKKSVKKVSKKK